MTQFIDRTLNQLRNICFADESTILLNDTVNKHKYLNIFREGHIQYPKIVNVWEGIQDAAIVGILFLKILDEAPDFLITEEVENQTR